MEHIAGTYIQISREDLESWLNDSGYMGQWERDRKFAGIYVIKLSPSVAVKLSSTIGSEDDAMGRGQASMQLSLVSLVTGRVLNKKAQGQSHFKRTLGWKKTWKDGIETMRNAYMASADFYDTISLIEDREKYKTDLLKMIELAPGWGSSRILVNIHRRVEQGGVLVTRDMDDMKEEIASLELADYEKKNPPLKPVVDDNEIKATAARALFVAARHEGDSWTVDFITSVGKRIVNRQPLSAPQVKILKDKLTRYGIQDSNGKPASLLF